MLFSLFNFNHDRMGQTLILVGATMFFGGMVSLYRICKINCFIPVNF